MRPDIDRAVEQRLARLAHTAEALRELVQLLASLDTAWGWSALGLMWIAALTPAIDLFDEVACAPRSARRVVEDLVPSNATPANRLFAVDRDPLEGRAPVRAGE